MCKRNLFCFCLFCLLLPSVLLFSRGGAAAGAGGQQREGTRGGEVADINKKLLEIYALYCKLHESQSSFSRNAAELDKSSESIYGLFEYPCVSQIKDEIKELEEKRTEPTAEVAKLCQTLNKNPVTQSSELQDEGKVKELREVVLQNADEWKNSETKDVTEELETVNKKCEVTGKVNKEIEIIDGIIERNPGLAEQRENYKLFLKYERETKEAAKMVKQKAEELIEKLKQSDKMIKEEKLKAEQLKAEQERLTEKAIEGTGKKEDMSERKENINESPQQPAETERTENNDRSIADTSTVERTAEKDDNSQLALEENTNKTNRPSDTLNNQTPPNNNTKKEQLFLTLGDSAARAAVDVLSLLFGVFTLLGRYVY